MIAYAEFAVVQIGQPLLDLSRIRWQRPGDGVDVDGQRRPRVTDLCVLGEVESTGNVQAPVVGNAFLFHKTAGFARTCHKDYLSSFRGNGRELAQGVVERVGVAAKVEKRVGIHFVPIRPVRLVDRRQQLGAEPQAILDASVAKVLRCQRMRATGPAQEEQCRSRRETAPGENCPSRARHG